MSKEDELNILKRLITREKAARKSAENILEEKSLELYNLNASLENELAKRSKELYELAKFPNQNPHPVLRINSSTYEIIFSNRSAKDITHAYNNNKTNFKGFLVEKIKSAILKNNISNFQHFVNSVPYDFTLTPLKNEDYLNLYCTNITEKVIAEEITKNAITHKTNINNLTQASISNASFDELIRLSIVAFAQYFDKKMLSAFFVNEKENTLSLYRQFAPKEIKHKLQKSVGTQILSLTPKISPNNYYSQVIKSKKPIFAQSIKELKKFMGDRTNGTLSEQQVTDLLNNSEVKTLSLIPIVSNNSVFTILGLTSTKKLSKNDKKDINIISTQINSVFDKHFTEKRLLENEEKYRSLVELAEDIIYQTDTDANLTYINPIGIKISGYSNDELLNKKITDLIPKDYINEVNDKFNAILSLKKLNTYSEFPIVTKSGKTIWLGQNIQALEENNIIKGYIAFARDITDRRIMQERLQRSEEKYRGIIENLEMGLLEIDNDNLILKAHPRFCEILGYSKHELEGKNAFDLLLIEQDKQERIRLNDKSFHKAKEVYETRLVKKDKSIIWSVISGAPLYDEENTIIGSIGIHWNITKRKELQNELIIAKEEAEVSLKHRKIFMAHMSHEIRTPLNGIFGMSKLLNSEPLSENQKLYLNAITSSSQHLNVIINDILDISKMEAGKLELDFQPVDLEEIISNCCSLQKIQANEKGIICNYIIDNKIHKYPIIDPVRLSQILINLLSNGIKFTEIGSVIVELKLISNHSKNQRVEFCVSDTGIGIAKDKLDTIFNSFIQEEQGVNRKYGGTGLGLTITKEIISLFNSEIKVISKKGKGSSFLFELLLEKGKQEDCTSLIGSEHEFDSLKNKTILLVEDNMINQLMAKTLLEKKGMIVSTADNGQEAIDALEKSSYSAVLMDLQMPLVDGIEATMIIRDKISQTIPIIALTANAIEGEKEKCFNAGMNDFIAKPFEPDTLYSKLEFIIRKSSKIPTI